jgi:hypothetical protein
MNKRPYKKYWFTRRAIERLIGEIRPSVAYHIKRLEKYNAFEPTMRKRMSCVRQEGSHEVFRRIDLFDLFALKIIAESYNTVRAESVAKRCEEIIILNNNADFNKIKTVIID